MSFTSPGEGGFGENERVKPLAATAGGAEAFLEAAGVGLGLGVQSPGPATAALARLTTTRRIVPKMRAALGVRTRL